MIFKEMLYQVSKISWFVRVKAPWGNIFEVLSTSVLFCILIEWMCLCWLQGFSFCLKYECVCFDLGPVHLEWEREHLYFGVPWQVWSTDHQICTHLQVPLIALLTYKYRLTCKGQSLRVLSDSYFVVKRSYWPEWTATCENTLFCSKPAVIPIIREDTSCGNCFKVDKNFVNNEHASIRETFNPLIHCWMRWHRSSACRISCRLQWISCLFRMLWTSQIWSLASCSC